MPSPVANHRFDNISVVDNVTPDMLHLIDPHWYQFPPMDPMWHGIIGLTITILGVIAWCGNGMVIYIFTTTKSLRTPANLLILNLAFSDFCMMVIQSPPMVINCYFQTWIFGPLMCDIYAMSGSLFGCASIWSMTMIAYDRYNVIVKGMQGKPLTIKGAILKIIIIWLFGLIWTLAPMFGWNRYVPEGNMTACGTDYLTKDWMSRSYILVYSCFVYYLPLLTIIYSYVFIIKTVAAHEAAMKAQAKKMNVKSLRSTEGDSQRAEFKLAKVALVTISLWFFAWTPYLVINYCGIFESVKLTPIFTVWGSVFAKANAVYNPIVYGTSHPKYRQALEAKCPWFVCGSTEEKSAAGSTADTVSATSNGTSEGESKS